MSFLDAGEQYALLTARHHLVAVAYPKGPLHSYWDVISDIDFLLQGKRTMSRMSAPEMIKYCSELLNSTEGDE